MKTPLPTAGARTALVERHLRFGWWAILLFASLGLGLEALHAFKASWYVDVGSDTRRLLWTLAHAHGTLLGLANVAFAATAALRVRFHARRLALASPCLFAASVLVPAGFFLGGAFAHAGDPGLGVLLVPPGALLFLLAVVLTAI
jgi:hypothetical protein